MNKSFIYISMAFLLTGLGCKKTFNDSIQGQTADQRITAALAAYQKKLSGSPNGWIMIENTTGTAFNQGVSQKGPKASFSYYLQFNDSNKVSMFSDFDTSMAATPKISSFRLKALQRPVLIFDTYSYLHVPCDPDPSVSRSPFGTGFGWGTDFEFSFADSVSASSLGDTIHLKGNLNNADVVLIKATKDQHDAYYSGQLKTTMLNYSQILNYFKRVSSGSNPSLFEITPSVGGGNSMDINWLDGSGNLKSATSNYYFTVGSVNFTSPVTIGSQTITGFNSLVWDPASSTISGNLNGGSAITITGTNAPIKIDVNAPFTWWGNSITSGSYYFSNNGFHVNGVDDYYGVTNLPGWHYMIFWSRYNASGTTYYDAFAGYAGSGLTGLATFSPDPPPATSSTKSTFTPDGRIIFKRLGAFGSATSILNTVVRTQIVDPSGYYLILKEDGKSYDMVVSSDAKSWISWSPLWNQ